MSVEPRKLLRRAVLTSVGRFNPGDVVAPAASATVTAWDSTAAAAANPAYNADALAYPPEGLKYRRILVMGYVSHVLDVVVKGSVDGGTNWDFSTTTTIAATTATIINISTRGYPHIQIQLVETAAATLTTCRLAIIGDPDSANTGA